MTNKIISSFFVIFTLLFTIPFTYGSESSLYKPYKPTAQEVHAAKQTLEALLKLAKQVPRNNHEAEQVMSHLDPSISTHDSENMLNVFYTIYHNKDTWPNKMDKINAVLSIFDDRPLSLLGTDKSIVSREQHNFVNHFLHSRGISRIDLETILSKNW